MTVTTTSLPISRVVLITARRAALAACAVVMILVFFASSAADADGTVNVCGTLDELQRPNGLSGLAGSATIAGRLFDFGPTWSATGSSISRYAIVGNRVCLTGTLIPQTNSLSSYVIGACGDSLGTSGCPQSEGVAQILGLPVALPALALLAGLVTLFATGWWHGRRFAET